MNKEQLITRNSGVKLYDLSDPIDLHRMNMNLHYCSKKGKDPTFKLIAPFGHNLKFKADYYYFEFENTPITEQILEEMGFIFGVSDYEYDGYYYEFKRHGILYYHSGDIIFNNQGPINAIKTANQLQTLIELLK